METHRRTERDSVLVAGAIDVPTRGSQPVVQSPAGRVEGGKHDPGAQLHPSPPQAVLGLVPVAVHFLLERRSKEIARAVERPTMVGTLEGGRIAFLSRAQLKAPMGANIEQDRNITPECTGDDDAILADMAHNKITDVGELTDMRHPYPRPGKNVPQLQPVELRIRKHPHRHFPAV